MNNLIVNNDFDNMAGDSKDSAALRAVQKAAAPHQKAFQEAAKKCRSAWFWFWTVNVLIVIALTVLNTVALGWPWWLVFIMMACFHAFFAMAVHAMFEAGLAKNWGAIVVPAIIATCCVAVFTVLAYMRYDRSDNIGFAVAGLFLDIIPAVLVARNTALASIQLANCRFANEMASDAVDSVRVADPGKQTKRLNDVMSHLRNELNEMVRSQSPNPTHIAAVKDFLNRVRRDHPDLAFDEA